MKIDGRSLSHETSEQFRIIAIRRVKEGEQPSSVMRSYGLCRTTIYRWLRAAKRGGEQALKARKHPGRKRTLSSKQAYRYGAGSMGVIPDSTASTSDSGHERSSRDL